MLPAPVNRISQVDTRTTDSECHHNLGFRIEGTVWIGFVLLVYVLDFVLALYLLLLFS
jgi:hypothetical protein